MVGIHIPTIMIRVHIVIQQPGLMGLIAGIAGAHTDNNRISAVGFEFFNAVKTADNNGLINQT